MKKHAYKLIQIFKNIKYHCLKREMWRTEKNHIIFLQKLIHWIGLTILFFFFTIIQTNSLIILVT